MLIRAAPQNRGVVALGMRAGEEHFAARVSMNHDRSTAVKEVGDFYGPRVVVGRHVLGILLALGQRAVEEVHAYAYSVLHCAISCCEVVVVGCVFCCRKVYG